MSTMLEGEKGNWVVSTLVKEGKRRKIPRGRKAIISGDFADVQAEATKQATEARRLFGVPVKLSEPVA